MRGIPHHHALEHVHLLQGRRGHRPPGIGPVVPWPEIHQRLGEERGRVVIGGKAGHHGAHRAGVRGIERGAIGDGCRAVSPVTAPRCTPARAASPSRRNCIAFRLASYAGRIADVSIGRLMLGPSAFAMPHQHMAQVESARTPSLKDLTASSWLKP